MSNLLHGHIALQRMEHAFIVIT